MWFLILILISFTYSLQIEVKSNFPLKKNNFSSVINQNNYKLIIKALKRIPEFKYVYYKEQKNKIIIYIERFPIVKRIKIKGNLYLRDYEIKNVLGLDEDSPLFETDSETLERILTEYYRELGFLNARVKVDIKVDKNGYAYVNIKVKEGDLYFLGDVLFEGRKKLSKAELIKISGLIIGEVFNRDKVLNAEDYIENYYRKKGFLGSFVFYRGYRKEKVKRGFKYVIFPSSESFIEKFAVGSKNLFFHPVATIKALIGKGKIGIPVYEIHEGEQIKFVIKGNEFFSDGEILELFDYDTVSLDIFSLENYKEKIIQTYRSKGFFDVNVNYELKDKEVVINITEGERYKAKLYIDGNYYEFPYEKEKINKLIQEKINYLKELGYLNATYKYREEINENRKEVNVFVNIEKGFIYILGSIKIKDELFKEMNRDLEAILPSILKEEILDMVFTTVDRVLKEKGYFDAQVNVNIKPVLIKDLMVLHYEISIDKGERYTYGQNIFYGYKNTRKRELSYMLVKKKYFDKKNEEDSVWNLIESDIFASVQLENLIDRRNKKVHRIINVKEKKRGVFEAFVGYSTYEKLKFGFGVTLRNLLGIGLINRNSYTKSKLYELYEVKLKDNFFFTRKLFTELSLFSRYDDRDFYELFTRGGAYLLGYRLSRFTSLALSVSRFRAKTKGAENKVLHLTKLSALLRSKYVTLKFGKSLSGKDYYTFEVNARYGKDIVKNLFGFRVRGGYGYASSEAPIFERFFLGGFQYMKGYSYQSIGAPKGRRQFLYLSPELYRVFKESVEFITFVEVGNAEDKFSKVIKNLKYDVGVALGLRTPAGLLRGEVAYPLEEYKFSPGKIKFYLSVDLRF